MSTPSQKSPKKLPLPEPAAAGAQQAQHDYCLTSRGKGLRAELETFDHGQVGEQLVGHIVHRQQSLGLQRQKVMAKRDIELPAQRAGNVVQGSRHRHRDPVGARARHRVEGVADAHDSGFMGNGTAHHTSRIALANTPLVV